MIALWLALAVVDPCADPTLRQPPRDVEAATRLEERLRPLALAGDPERSGSSADPERSGSSTERVLLAQEQLASRCAASRTLASGAVPDLRPALERILARPEFSHARERGADPAWLFRKLRAWLDALFALRGAQRYAVGTRVVVLAAGLAAVLAGALALARRRGHRKARTLQPELAARAPLEDSSAHLGRAHALLTGDPRAAVREACLALLSCLERRQLARPDRVRTNRELVRELPGRGASAEVVSAVSAMLTWYDDAFYSLAPVQSAQAARFTEDVARLEQSLRGGG